MSKKKVDWFHSKEFRGFSWVENLSLTNLFRLEIIVSREIERKKKFIIDYKGHKVSIEKLMDEVV